MRKSLALRVAGACRRLAWILGRFERRYSPPQVTLIDLAQQLTTSRSDLVFVQIGANDGVRFDPMAELRGRVELRGAVVEPLSEMHASLKTVYSHHPNVALVLAAIHKDATQVDMYRVKADSAREEWMLGIASLSPTHYQNLGVPAESMEVVSVPAMTISALLSDLRLDRLDLFIMDCEGYDLDILDMLDLETWRPAVIQFEHGLAGGSVDRRRLADAIDRLRRSGYESTVGGEDVIAYLPAQFWKAR